MSSHPLPARLLNVDLFASSPPQVMSCVPYSLSKWAPGEHGPFSTRPSVLQIVAGSILAPQREVHVPESVNGTFLEKKKKKLFAVVIKLRILIEKSSQIIWVSLNPKPSVIIRDGRGNNSDQVEATWRWRRGVDLLSQKPRDSWNHQKQETILPWSLRRKHHPSDTWILTSALQNWETIDFYYFKPPHLW